jgi:hypothetical protein
MKNIGHFALCACLLLPATVSISRAQPAQVENEQRFVDIYRCAVLKRLDFIHTHGDLKKHGRFFVVDLPDSPLTQNYVQCLFIDHDMRMLCEAASGYYFDKPGKPRTAYVPRKSIAALAELGFSTDDSHGNFQRMMPTPDETGRLAVSELVLKALYRGYGGRIGNRLMVTTPLAGEKETPLKPLSCPVIS